MDDYYDLGAYKRTVTTSSPQTQLWFDRGLNWLYGFNHAEAIKCFEKALETDPGCAMAYWGQALVLGPNINAVMTPEDEPKAHEAAQKAPVGELVDIMDVGFACAFLATPYARKLLATIQAEYGACAVEVLFRDRPLGNVLVTCSAAASPQVAEPYTDERNRADIDLLRSR